jgi:Fe-S cluster assembly protein SufD
MTIIEKYQKTESLFFDAHNPEKLQARRHALAHFNEMGLPTRQSDDWKYTDLSRFALDTFHPIQTLNQTVFLDNPESIHPLLIDPKSSQQWVFYNGQALKEFSPTLFLMDKFNTPGFETYFKNSLQALNQAFHHNGAYLALPKKSVIRDPIYIVHLIDPETAPIMGHPKNIITLAENAHATLVEIIVNRGKQSSFTNTVTNIKLAKNATLSHLFLQRSDAPSTQIAHIHIEQAENSCYRGTAITLGGSVNRASFQIDLNGTHAECEFQSLELAAQHTQMDIHLTVNHYQPQCESRTVTRGVIKDHAKSTFTGKIVVHKNADKTIASLENKNMLLSPQAEANTRPQLEIYNHDIQCSHGATIGHLDPDALFYLQSRGVPKEEAEQLLINSFIAPSLEGLSVDIQQYIAALINEH